MNYKRRVVCHRLRVVSQGGTQGVQVMLYDFTSLGNFGNDPLRAKQLAMASTIDLDTVKVDVWRGPAGGHGFRSGTWTAEYAGLTWRFFSSVSHYATLDQQREQLTRTAALVIAGLLVGYVQQGQHGASRQD